LQNDLLVMPEFFLPLAFCLSGSMIVVAVILLRASVRHSREAQRLAARRSPQTRVRGPRQERRETQRLFSGATAAALEAAHSNPARQRQVRVYS
jgi:hypothetical protein